MLQTRQIGKTKVEHLDSVFVHEFQNGFCVSHKSLLVSVAPNYLEYCSCYNFWHSRTAKCRRELTLKEIDCFYGMDNKGLSVLRAAYGLRSAGNFYRGGEAELVLPGGGEAFPHAAGHLVANSFVGRRSRREAAGPFGRQGLSDGFGQAVHEICRGATRVAQGDVDGHCGDRAGAARGDRGRGQ